MITTQSVHAPPVEEFVHAGDLVRVPNNYDDDDGDDALSLYNLSLYCDAADDSFTANIASTSSSSSSDHNDFFEFSSIGDSDASSDLHFDNQSIVFCGKLIPRRESPPNPPPTPLEKKRSSLLTSRRSQKSASRSTRSPTVRRRKCRWYLMAFGLARFPTEMALSEMRMRQSHNIEKRGLHYGSVEILWSGDCGSKSKVKWLFGLLKALGSCHHRRADALVKAP